MMVEDKGRKVEVLRQLLVLKRQRGVAVKKGAAAVERGEIRAFVSRLRGRVELHKGGSVLDIVLDHIDRRR